MHFYFYVTLSFHLTVSLLSVVGHKHSDINIFTLFRDPFGYGHFHDPIFVEFGTLHTLEGLSYVANKEENIHKILTWRRRIVQKEIDLIRSFISDYEDSSQKAVGKATLEGKRNLEKLVKSSSVLVHRMQERYATFVFDLRQLLSSQSYQSIQNNEEHTLQVHFGKRYQSRWPQPDDLLMSHVAIYDIQNIYNLDPETIFQGALYETKYHAGTLNTSHCVLFGTAALRMGHYVNSIKWLEFAEDYMNYNFEGRDDLVSFDLVNSLTVIAIQQHNYEYQIHQQSGFPYFFLLVHFFTKPVSFREHLNIESSPRWPFRVAIVEDEGQKYGNATSVEPAHINMIPICMGQYFQPEELKASLHCYLERQRHPYFILNPVKTEILSEHPYIVQFYDVLGPQTMEEMYWYRGNLHLSTTKGSPIEDSINVRTSAGSVPFDLDFTNKIQNKSEMLTGLLLSDFFEGIQTVEYTYGRMYKIHMDPLSVPGEPLDRTVQVFGDRVATVLYYLDEPVSGGATPFGEVGIAAQAVSGSAVFWLNMYRNGTIRSDVSHGSCPIIYGHKTIINNWIRYNSNFQTFKCSLNQLE